MLEKRGQGAVEFVAVLGMMLLIVLVVLTISNQRLIDLSTQKIMAESRSSVRNLADAANHVYAQGTGAKKYVFIRLPVDANMSRSNITGRTIILNVRGTDISALTDAPVQGSFPSSPGGAWLKVESFGTYVQIGNYYLELNAGSLYVNMANSTTTSVAVTALNRGNRSINVTIYPTWRDLADPLTKVNLTVLPASAEISEAASATFTITLISGQRSGGIYTGLLTFNATYSDGGEGPNETADVPLTVEVSIQPVYRNVRDDINQSTLVIILLSNATSASIGKNLSGSGGSYNNPYDITLFVCARPETDVSDVHIYSLNQSSTIFGIFGLDWYWTGALTPSQCKSRNINFTSNTSPVTGTYYETIIAIPINASTAMNANNATLQIGAAIDASGPSIVAGSVSLSPAYPRTSVNISANASDTGGLGGQVWIDSCILQNASVRNYSMSASDGAFDTQLEEISYNFTSISDGNVSLNMSCNDSFGNRGANYTLNFTVDSKPPVFLSTNINASCGSLGNPCSGGTYPNETKYFYLGNPIWLNLSIDDSSMGASNIANCSLYLDSGPLMAMGASDGSFNATFEYANISLGTLSMASHSVEINCSDSHGNIATNYTVFLVSSACQNIDTPGDNVILQSDVHASGGGTCFNITASGANLNCNNFAISGLSNSGTYGIYANASNVGVGNCTVTSFDSGILYNRTLNGRIENVTANSNTNAGVYLLSANLTNISVISASSNAIGAYLVNVTGGNITSGTMYGATALRLSQTNSVTVARVYMNATGFHIRLDYSSTNNTFFYNNITGSGAWVNNTGTANDNYFNTSLGSGAGAGNYYWNVTLYDANDTSPFDGFADKGTQYPFNWTYLGALWNVSGNDSGPATSRQS